jgi:uncharacterized protein YoxC
MLVINIIASILGIFVAIGGLVLIIYLLVNKIKFNKELKNIVVIDPKVENEALKNVLKDRNKYIEYLQSQNENLSKKIKEFLNEKER